MLFCTVVASRLHSALTKSAWEIHGCGRSFSAGEALEKFEKRDFTFS